MIHDYCVIGGGIVGLATAMALLDRRPDASLILLEKAPHLAAEQTSHNSGVIHSGIYYEPGSQKAEFCRQGAALTVEFAQEHGISVEVCGKLIVATTSEELVRLRALAERGRQNRVEVEPLDAQALAAIEPHIRGLGALLVPSTGIVDYHRVAEAMARRIRELGAEIVLDAQVTGIVEHAEHVDVSTADRRVQARRMIACAGVQADRLARLAGLKIDFQIVPFRGEYYRLPVAHRDLIRHLIYPVPDPALPFLGVHLTRTVEGGITVGPNAVLATAREGYPKFSFNARDVAEYARFPGMWRFAARNVRTGATEIRNSLVKRAYLAECRKYCPELSADDLLPAPAGIRAQAMRRDGALVHDFLFAETPRMLHVGNAPSPAATSAIPIGRQLAARVDAGS